MVSESVAKCTRPLNAAAAAAPAAAAAAGHYFHFYLAVFILGPARSRREKRRIPPELNLTLVEVTSIYFNL